MGAFTARLKVPAPDLPIATTEILGGVIIGETLTIDEFGVLDTLPIPTESLIVKPAGAAIGGHRLVYIGSDGKAHYASNTISEDLHRTIGITLNAAELDASLSIQYQGEITESSWAWTMYQPIYMGADGLLTQTPPSSPALFQRIVGFPTSTTSMFVEFRDPIVLSS